jgi:shikimate kinase
MLKPQGRLDLSNEIRSQIPTAETMDAYLGTFDNLIKDIPYLAAKEFKNDLTTFGREVLKDPNFSFREEAIADPKKNLNIPEAKVAQRWMMSGGINPNFAKAIDLMPYNNVPVLREYAYKGNTTERIKHPKSRKGDNYINISSSSGKINQPTGIDRNIKRDFFTKTDQRIGNDFLWTKNNFSEEYFLGKIGIKDKKKEASFTQRESEAQTLKGVLRYITKEMTLKAFSERAQELGLSNQVNDLRSAKNVYSASQTAIRDFDMPKQKDFLENKLSDIAQDFKVNYAGVPDKSQIRSVVKKYLLDDFYTTKDKNDIIDALAKGLKKAEASMEYNKKVFNDISKVDIEKFLKDHTKEIIEGDFERINEDYLSLKRGELQEVSTDPEVQKARRLRDEAAWGDYMENSTDKLKAAEVLASLNEQYTNSSTIGGKRHVYWGGTANWRAGLNKVINKYGINLEKTTLTQGDKKVKVKKYGGSNFHNSEKFIKQAGLKSNSKLSDYKSGKVKELVEEYDRVALEARKFLEAQLLSETQAFMNGEITTTKSGVSPEAQMGIAMMALKNSMGSVLRLAAPVRGIYIPLGGEKLITTNSRKYIDPRDGKSKSEKLLTWEHNKSAEKMLLDLLKVYSNKDNLKTIEGTNKIELNEKGKTELETAYEDFYVNIIPYKMDGVLRRTGYEVLSPIEGTRYYNKSSMYDPNMRAIYNFKTKKVEGEAWAKSAELAINPKLAKDNLKTDPIFAASESNTRTNVDFLNHAKNNDKALALARKPNKKPKKIRVFDFDDTLAKSKSLVFYNRPNTSGKPSPKRKAIFMIGGPGSGKSNIGKGLELGREGWKVVNQDIFIEAEKAKVGLPEAESMYSKEQKSQRSKIGFAGRKAAEAKMEKYRQAGEGMVIDGTGASYNATMKKVNKLKEQGYEVFMVHAETSTEAAMSRNRARKERSLPDFIVEKTSKAVQESVKRYREELGDKFIEIDTETIEYGKPLPKDFVNKVKTKVYENERGVLNAEEFARDGKSLINEGAVMDFTDFNIVREGERGPMFKVAEKIRDARGTDDVFVLTARAPEAQQAIHEFLKSEGLDIPIENITGLGNSTGEAKAQWLVSKAAEGYNDFFFADDAMANVKAVKEALEPLDIKSKTQQVFASNSENRSLEFNKLLEESTGIEYYKEYSAAKAKTIGASKGKFKFFIPHSAEDFVGLIYPTLTKGKLGDKQMAWYKENLLNPYSRAMDNLSRDRVQLLTDFKALKKELNVPKDLRKEAKTGFTKEQAVRVYLFEKAGFGKELDKTLSQTDKADLLKVVESDATLKTFAEQIFNVTKGDGYSKPGENWLVGTITTDLLDLINTGKRSKYLEEWQSNVDQIYSKQNLNKLEAIYGTKYREALENILARMKAGKNRLAGGNRLSNQMLDYVNGSNAAIMFFNVRSAALQMISNINYVNWSFNNPLKAGAAVANQPQYWKDVVKLLNSDYLMDRRNGLKLNINESEIADAASTSKNKFKAGIQYILQKGYLPTQYADSFAIASGGATYYRNRINDLIKNEGKTLVEAEKASFNRVETEI